jgi:iron(III) transport system permease protein
MLVFSLDYYLSKKFRFSLVTGKTSRVVQVELGRYSILANIFLVLMSVVLFVMPVAAILIASLSRVQGSRELSNFTLDNFSTILFDTDETYRALGNSLLLSTVTAIICCIMATFLPNKVKN